MPINLPQLRLQDSCPNQGTTLFSNLNEQELSQLNNIVHLINLNSDEYLLHQKSPATYVYNIMSGTLLVERIGLSGRRQILGFMFPGHFFGFTHGQFF